MSDISDEELIAASIAVEQIEREKATNGDPSSSRFTKPKEDSEMVKIGQRRCVIA